MCLWPAGMAGERWQEEIDTMAKHYSAFFKKSHKDFVKKGVFDGYIGKDAKLHVDPLLLKHCTTPEFIGAYE